MPQIDTVQNEWQLAGKTANISATSTVTDRPYATGTKAAGPSASAQGVIVPTSDNNLKVQVLVETSAFAVDTRVVGWRFCTDTLMWVPELLGQFTTTAHTVALPAQINSKTFYPAISAVVNQGSANIRQVNGTGYGAPASLLIDHQGCQYIELIATTASAKAVNYLFTCN